MTDFDDTNRGVLFQEQEKKSEKAPDYTGKLDVEGTEYRIAGWQRIGKSGKPFLSLSISIPEKGAWEQAGSKFKPDTVHEGDDINLDDIPF
jgi:uncharacterized protein (DUF736 family)